MASESAPESTAELKSRGSAQLGVRGKHTPKHFIRLFCFLDTWH